MLSVKKIQEVIKNSERCQKLFELNLSEIQIRRFTPQINKAIEKCTNLDILILNGCELESLDNMPECDLTVIQLSGNKLGDSELVKLEKYPNLGHLIFTENNVCKLDTIKVFSKHKHMQQLDLSDNPVTKEKNYRYYVFNKLKHLEVLDRFDRKGNEQVEEPDFEDDEDDDEQGDFDDEDDDEDDLSEDEDEEQQLSSPLVVQQSIQGSKKQYTEMNSKITQKEESLAKYNQYFDSLRREVQQLITRIDQLEALKNVSLQFRYEKFNYVDALIPDLLNNLSQIEQQGKQYLIQIWKKFIEQVNLRDKKVKDFQTGTKQKGNQLTSKDKLVNVLQESLKEMEGVFLSALTQVKEFLDFINNTEKKLHSLADKNLSQRSEFEQEKILQNYKMIAENEAKGKMRQNIQSCRLVDEQTKQMKRMAHQAEMSYEKSIVEQQKKLIEICSQLSKAKTDLDMKKTEFEEKENVIKRMKEEKEKWKLECNKLGARFNVISQKSEMGMLEMEMEEYKKKIMCNYCVQQEKFIVLKTCPHAFCKKCIEEMYYSTNRKCYLCGVNFEKSDVHPIILS